MYFPEDSEIFSVKLMLISLGMYFYKSIYTERMHTLIIEPVSQNIFIHIYSAWLVQSSNFVMHLLLQYLFVCLSLNLFSIMEHKAENIVFPGGLPSKR